MKLVLIFMGVSGSGKTTVAKIFANKTGAVFYEGDDFHPAENIEKMRAGISLTDEDRAPWLQALRKIIVQALANSELTALTCSALKSKYRSQLQGGDPCVKFVYLTGPPALIGQRLSQRRGHFMAPSREPVGGAGTARGRPDVQLRKITGRNCNRINSDAGNCRT